MDAADLRFEGKKSSSFRSRFITESQDDSLGPGPPGFLVALAMTALI